MLRDDHENRRLSPGLPRLCNAPGRIDPGRQRVLQFADASSGREQPGESRLRMLRIVRKGDRHDPRISRCRCASRRLRGAFLEGRADGIIPGETLKGFVHQVARDHAGAEIEIFGLALCQRMLAASSGYRVASRSRAALVSDGRRRQSTGSSLRRRQSRAADHGGNQQRHADRRGLRHRSARADAHLELPPRRRRPGRTMGRRMPCSRCSSALSVRWTCITQT